MVDHHCGLATTNSHLQGSQDQLYPQMHGERQSDYPAALGSKHEDRVRLQELLEAHKKPATVYILMGDRKHIWEYHYPGAAKRF